MHVCIQQEASPLASMRAWTSAILTVVVHFLYSLTILRHVVCVLVAALRCRKLVVVPERPGLTFRGYRLVDLVLHSGKAFGT